LTDKRKLQAKAIAETKRLGEMQSRMLVLLNSLAGKVSVTMAGDLTSWAEDVFGGEQESLLDGADESYTPTVAEEEEEEEEDVDDPNEEQVEQAVTQADVVRTAGLELQVRRSRQQAGKAAGPSFTLEQLRGFGPGST
jgi:hypothetical protein